MATESKIYPALNRDEFEEFGQHRYAEDGEIVYLRNGVEEFTKIGINGPNPMLKYFTHCSGALFVVRGKSIVRSDNPDAAEITFSRHEELTPILTNFLLDEDEIHAYMAWRYPKGDRNNYRLLIFSTSPPEDMDFYKRPKVMQIAQGEDCF